MPISPSLFTNKRTVKQIISIEFWYMEFHFFFKDFVKIDNKNSGSDIYKQLTKKKIRFLYI